MGDPNERKLAHRVSAAVKVLGASGPRHPPGAIARKGTHLRAGGSAANYDSSAGGAAMFEHRAAADRQAISRHGEPTPRRAVRQCTDRRRHQWHCAVIVISSQHHHLGPLHVRFLNGLQLSRLLK